MCASGTGLGSSLKRAGRKISRGLRKVRDAHVDAVKGVTGYSAAAKTREMVRDQRQAQSQAKDARRHQEKEVRKARRRRQGELRQASMMAKRNIGRMTGSTGNRTMLGVSGSSQAGKQLLGA